MPAYRLSAVAERQIREILAWTETRFGADARRRYATLLVTAMGDTAADLTQPGLTWLPVDGHRLGLYHLAHSRRRVPAAARVVEPRHLLVVESADDGTLDILGVVHERMLRVRALRRLLREIDTV